MNLSNINFVVDDEVVKISFVAKKGAINYN